MNHFLLDRVSQSTSTPSPHVNRTFHVVTPVVLLS